MQAAQETEFRHLLNKSLDAQRGGMAAWRMQSTGEKLAVAMVLNRADWLTEMSYSIAEALDRIGPEWVELIPGVAKRLENEGY